MKDFQRGVLDEGNYPNVEQIYGRIGEFRELAVTSEERNRALKKLVERIVDNREGALCFRKEEIVLFWRKHKYEIIQNLSFITIIKNE